MSPLETIIFLRGYLAGGGNDLGYIQEKLEEGSKSTNGIAPTYPRYTPNIPFGQTGQSHG